MGEIEIENIRELKLIEYDEDLDIIVNKGQLSLKNITIRNFRTFGDTQKINIDKINLIVGKNDSGKTNFIRALKTFLDESISYKNEDRATLKSGRRTNQSTLDDIEIIGELEYICNEDIVTSEQESVILRKKREAYIINDKQFTYQDVMESKILPNFKIIDVFDDLTNFLFLKFMDIKSDLKKDINNKLSYSGSSIISSVERYLDEVTDKMNYNNMVDLILDLLKIRGKDYSIQSVLQEVNSYLNDFWGNSGQNTISVVNDTITSKDENHLEVLLENRGSGFQAFIYVFISMILAARSFDDKEGLILIEEPEKMLHPQAQRDFIKAVEAISNDYKNCKFIITTHSPVIVNYSNRGTILLLDKNKSGETKIITKAYENNWKQLRNNLGVLPSDSLIFGKVNLIVEGASEYLFIKNLLEKMEKHLDLDNISIINAGGASNIEKLVKVTKGEQAILNKVVVLVDGDIEGDRAIRDLLKEENSLLHNKYILSLRDQGNIKKDIAFEDLFPWELRLAALKSLYSDRLSEISKEEIVDFVNHSDNFNMDQSWAKYVEGYLKSKNILKEDESLNKIEICKYLVDNINKDKIHDKIIKLAEIISELQD